MRYRLPSNHLQHCRPSDPIMRERMLASGLRIASATVMIFAYGVMAHASWNSYRVGGSPSALGLVAVNTIFVILFVIRRDATVVTSSLWLWLLAFAGSGTPLLMRPSGTHYTSIIGSAVQLIGTVGIIASLLSLQRSFGIVPANRGIRHQGLYNVVRHPLYATELLTIAGFTISNPSISNISLFVIDCCLQFARAVAEERLLEHDADYVGYRNRIKYRLIPGIL